MKISEPGAFFFGEGLKAFFFLINQCRSILVIYLFCTSWGS